jgi:hypothetical protein
MEDHTWTQHPIGAAFFYWANQGMSGKGYWLQHKGRLFIYWGSSQFFAGFRGI